jgi:NAD(P)-dependent dehydrogenase (short-subunit alcohol dehydrogenase family)
VTDQAQATAAIDAAVERFGQIDVLVNNAGYGLFGGVEEISDAEARAIFDTSVFGLLNVTRAALPALRRQRRGRIINIGSSVGFGASPGRGMYGASKSAVEAITEALHGELAPHSIHVTIVEPGSFRIGFLTADSMRQPAHKISAYDDTVGKLYDAIAKGNGQQPGDPVKAAVAIRQLATATKPPVRLQLGSDCVGLVEGKIATVAQDLDEWRDLALSTDF